MKAEFVYWVKQNPSNLASLLRAVYRKVCNPEIPPFTVIYGPVLLLHSSMAKIKDYLLRVFYFTPLFKTRIGSNSKNLLLYSGMPQVLGNLHIQLGKNVRISGISTLCGRNSAGSRAELVIGDNVDIGWQNSISVGTRVVLGDHVRLAGRVFLAGFPGHPLDANKRRLGLPEEDWQAKDIILENDVWVGTGATVLAGVSVGQGSIIAAGSVVTKSVPSGVVVAGNPAVVVKQL